MPRSRGRLQGPARVLVVADPPLSDLVRVTLNHGLYEVETIAKRAAAEQRTRQWEPHLMVVDVALREGGSSALIGLVLAGHRIPTIVLTARGDLKTKLAAFEHGADDFVTVPFSPEELVARVLAVMRRSYGEAVPFVPMIKLGGLEIDMLEQHVRVGQRTLRLTTMEQAILYLLASNPGVTLDREMILDTLWGADFQAESNLVDRHIRNLRVKLKDSWRKPRYIETVSGKGYRFRAQP